MGSRGACAIVACALAAGSLALTAGGDHRPGAARVAGAEVISDARLRDLVEVVDAGAVPAQFTHAEVAAHVLTELLDLELDTRLARSWGVAPDLRSAAKLLAAGVARTGSVEAFQQQLLRSPGAGWAGAEVYARAAVLRGQLAAAESRRLTPVPADVLARAYADRLGEFAHAHLEILTTPSLTTATADARAARIDPKAFPALVRRDTDDDTHRASGGDYGPALAEGQLFESVDDAVFGASRQSILGPIAVTQARPEYYVVRVLSVTDIPLAAAIPRLSAELLDPSGGYVAAALLRSRGTRSADVAVRSDLGSWDPLQLAVRPPAG